VLFGVALLAAIGGGGYLFLTGSQPAAGPESSVASAAAPAPDAAQAANAQPLVFPTAPPKKRPAADIQLPPINMGEYSLVRPSDQVSAAFQFAALYPDVLQYIPCFCGCQQMGHSGNDDCFVKARDANGGVTAWEPHGLGCEVCIDVATDARRMYASGATIPQIRDAIEQKYRPNSPTMTPTPMPPAGKQR
jgi:Protein of unknown function with PCYCGC motif